jgi:hypothetical protein
VIMEIGPVMHIDDLIAWKVAAIINRREVRDYIDTAAFLAEHSATDLIAMARRVDPGLDSEDVVMVGRMLDRMPDAALAEYAVTSTEAVAELRRRSSGAGSPPGHAELPLRQRLRLREDEVVHDDHVTA